MAAASSSGICKNSPGQVPPRIATHTQIGDKLSATPNHKCAAEVKRFANEYPNKNASTGSEAYSGKRLGRNKNVDATNPSEQVTMNNVTPLRDNTPAGKCLQAVRGLAASIR